MYTIICTTDNPCTLQATYCTMQEAKQALKQLQEQEYSRVLAQTISLYGKDYYKGIPKERLTGGKDSIKVRLFEIKELSVSPTPDTSLES